MIPPKYNFYVGKANNYVYIGPYTSIDDSGNFDYDASSDKYATGYENVPDRKNLFIDLQSSNSYNALFFYDKNKVFISRMSINSVKNTVIIPPANAEYYAMRFSATDEIFMLKRKTNFVYYVESVNPHYKDLSKKYAKESGQEFFRESLDGKINLFGKDYEIVVNSSLEDKLIFIVDKYNTAQNRWVEYYKGEFNKTDCKFDYDKRKCELKTTAVDNYNEVMNNYENTYDLIKLTPEISKINLHKRSLMQVYIRGANSISNFFGGVYWEDDVNEVIDNHNDLINKYYFAYIKAGNEFYVKNAGISGVNGVYAGTNGYWSCWNGYTCYMGTETPMTKAYIYIKRNSDNTILYQSVKQWVFTEAGNCYIGREDIEMVNVNDPNDKFTIESPFVYHIYRRLLCDVDTVTDSEGTKNTYDLPSNDFVTDNRNYKKCIGLTGGMFFCTSRAVDEPTRYGLNDYGQYFTNQFIPSSTGLGRPLPISRNSWANASLWYVYDISYTFFEQRLRKQYTLKDSYSIAAVIKALLNKIDPTIKHEGTVEYSSFLYGPSMPIYPSRRFFVYITQKTNILKGEYDQPAQKAEISLEEVMKMLRDCFRCYWYIEDGKFKIEHISFFMRGGSYSYNSDIQLDFTKLTDQFNKKLTSYFQSEVEYDKSDLNSRYEFGWMDDVTDLFGGVTIDVNSNYIQKDKNEEINISQFSSDIDYMLFNPSNFSDDGFALLCPQMHYYKYGVPYTGEFDSKSIGQDGTITDNTSWDLTDYIHIPNGGGKKVTIVQDPNGPISYVFAAFDKNKNPLGRFGEYTAMATRTEQLPANTEYIVTYKHMKNAYGEIVNTYNYDIYEGENVELTNAINLEIPIVETQLVDEDGENYDAIIQNFYASWAYLVNFYMYDMPASSIECNVLSGLYAQSVKMCQKHTIEFPTEEDLDKFELIKTSIGNGKIDEMSINMNTRTAKVKLMYKP